ncbi:MAG: hypothetical protein QG635_1461 [Bacteroidota bacterium]|nr:hypothetical protein [Bacteroidota bacterium]
MNLAIKCFIVFLAALIMKIESESQSYKVISGGTIINPDSKAIPNGIILIQDSIILEAGAKIGRKIPENAEIFDAKGKYIIPGLIDSHIHFFQSGGLYARPDGLDLRKRVPYEKEMKQTWDNMEDLFRRYAACGITTVFDMGGPYKNFDVRGMSLKFDFAPRVFTTGPLIASYQPKELTTDDPPIIKVNDINEALMLVNQEASHSPDYIKIWYITEKKSSEDAEEFYPIVKAIIKESHSLGLKVMVHATELETARKAVEAGCDVLVHIITDKEIDEPFLKLCKSKGISVIPTLWVFNSYNAVYSKQLKLLPVEHWLGNPKTIGTLFDMYEINYDELGERQRKLLVDKPQIKPSPIILHNLNALRNYGINIAAGTDAGNVGVIHGPALFHEFDYMTKAGLTNKEILASATINAAKMIGKDSILGSVKSRKLADLVILNSNPLEDIANMSDIEYVVKSGKLFTPAEILPKTPEDLAQIQLNAYNSRDLDAFLRCYSDDVEIYKFPDSLMYKGKEKMKELYGGFFDKAINLHCKLVNRINKDKFVIDQEFVNTGIPERENISAVAIYEVEGGFIKKVWFIRD